VLTGPRPFTFVIPGEAAAKRRRRPGIHASAYIEERDDDERRRRPVRVLHRIAGMDGEAWIPDTSSFAPLGRRSGMTTAGVATSSP